MNTENFTFDSFARVDRPVFADALAEQLQRAVLLEISPIVAKALEKIVLELNAVGHNLTPYREQGVGDFHFRSVTGKGECDLLLACDVVITSAFRAGISSCGSNNPDA